MKSTLATNNETHSRGLLKVVKPLEHVAELRTIILHNLYSHVGTLYYFIIIFQIGVGIFVRIQYSLAFNHPDEVFLKF